MARTASKKWLNANILPKDRKPTLLDQVPVFLLAGVAAEGAFDVQTREQHLTVTGQSPLVPSGRRSTS